jgi:hypothetical protein
MKNQTILEKHNERFLPHSISDKFNTMNGSCVAKWLESIGEEVVSHKDTGRNGEAVTESGFVVSTNGYVHPVR